MRGGGTEGGAACADPSTPFPPDCSSTPSGSHVGATGWTALSRPATRGARGCLRKKSVRSDDFPLTKNEIRGILGRSLTKREHRLGFAEPGGASTWHNSRP